MNGADIFKALLKRGFEFKDFDWFENKNLSEFEILISVILTQNTNWQNVLKALLNLKNANICDLQSLAKLEPSELANLIKPSGFYNTKAKRLANFTQMLLNEYGDLQNFKQNVSREWLLSVKGLGFESVDSILNYLCKREILVVDSYTNRLLNALGYEFEGYEELREFCESGIENSQDELCELLGKKEELYKLYQIFHALIISFCKVHFKGKVLSESGKEFLKNLI